MSRRDLLTLLLAAPTSAIGRDSDDDSARQLLRRMQEALGGGEELATVQDVDWTIKAKTWDQFGAPGTDVERRIRWICPKVFRKDQRNGERVIKCFFDGKGGWELVPQAGLVVLEGRELEYVREEANGTYPQRWLPDRKPGLRVISGGPGVIRVLSADGTSGKDIVVDLETGLPLRIVGTTLSGKIGTAYTRVPKRLEFAEWRTVAGIKWPQRLVNFHHEAKLADMTTTEIGIDVGLDINDLARKPNVE